MKASDRIARFAFKATVITFIAVFAAAFCCSLVTFFSSPLMGLLGCASAGFLTHFWYRILKDEDYE